MVFELNEEQLFDYMNCPIKYAIKYGKNHIKVEREVTPNKLINQVINGFCMKLKEGEVMRPDLLKRKWDMLCRQHPDKVSSEKIREGFGHLYRFYEYAEEHQLLVADIGSPYTIRVKDGADYYIYSGSLGIILANEQREPEGLKVHLSAKIPDQSDIDLNIKTTLDHVGFFELYKQPLVGTRIHYNKKNRDYYTTRDVESSRRKVTQIIANVGKSIRQNIWYPHETPFCSSCEIRDFCMMYGS